LRKAGFKPENFRKNPNDASNAKNSAPSTPPLAAQKSLTGVPTVQSFTLLTNAKSKTEAIMPV